MKNNLFFVILLLTVLGYECKIYNVNSSHELTRMLLKVQPGDIINMTAGEYNGRFKSNRNGTEMKRITLLGVRDTILTNPDENGFFLTGSWWILDGFSVFNASRGIILEHATNNILRNLHVSYTNTAGIRVRKNSTDNLIEYSTITHTGEVEPNNGEAIYIGAALGHWTDNYTGPDRSSRNTVSNNYIGPFVRAESVDIKEGVDNVLVESNYINGTGMADKNKSKTWVSVKGFNCTIINNYGIFSVMDGFTPLTVRNPITNSGCNNKFFNNTCSRLAKKGQCVNLSLASCKNEVFNNTIVA